MKRTVSVFILVFIMLSLSAGIPCAQNHQIKYDIDEALKKLRLIIIEEMEKWNVPGAAVVIVKDGQLIFAEGFGYGDIEKKQKVTKGTNFILASVTKAFTSMVVGLLTEDGKLDWDKPVKEYFPGFKLSDKYIEEKITFKDMLTHRSGLPRHDYVWFNSPFTVEEITERLQYLQFSAGLREKYGYNNLMYMAAGYLAGKAAGTTWEKLVKNRIFKPLGMERSGCSVEELLRSDGYSLSYREENGRLTANEFPTPEYKVGYYPRASGSVYSNVEDMSKWMIMHLGKGMFKGKRFISQNIISQMHSPQIVMPQSPYLKSETMNRAYGMGWTISNYRGHYSVSHTGGTMGYSTIVAMFPHENTGIIVLTNKGTPLPTLISLYASDLLLDLEPIAWNERIKPSSRSTAENNENEKKKSSKPPRPLAEYTGKYEHPAYGVIEIVIKESKLFASFHGGEPSLLEHDVYNIFCDAEDNNFEFSFYIDPKGRITHLTVPFERAVDPIVFNKGGI
ncbi:serine hydrolase [candidate division KSB1 bacterium]